MAKLEQRLALSRCMSITVGEGRATSIFAFEPEVGHENGSTRVCLAFVIRIYAASIAGNDERESHGITSMVQYWYWRRPTYCQVLILLFV